MKTFIYNITKEERPDSYTVVFIFSLIDIDELVDELRLFYHSNFQTNNIALIYGGYIKTIDGDELKSDLCFEFNFHESNVLVTSFTRNGQIQNLDQSKIQEIKDCGFLDIVKRNNPILESDQSFHYVFPSGKHANFFIRAGNLLTNSCDIKFLAFCLLRFVPYDAPTHIYCDTSSILPLVISLIRFIGMFDNLKSDISYSSFSSYYGIENHFFKDGSLVLISTSNSGDLEKRILQKPVILNIVTFIFNGTDRNTQNQTFFLKPHFNKLLSENFHIKRYQNESTCQLCKSNSIPVLVEGDQFIPGRNKIQETIFYLDHLPNWIKKFLDVFGKKEVIKCYKRDDKNSVQNKIREFHIDFNSTNALHGNSIYTKKLQSFQENYLPINTRYIITVDKNSSRTLALKFKEYIELNTSENNVMVLNPDKRDLLKISKESNGSIVVVSSCVTSGRKLVSISRDLRDLTRNKSVVYFCAITRLENSSTLSLLRDNLVYRSKTYLKNEFYSLFDIFLNDYHTMHIGSKIPNWKREYEYLQVFLNNTDLMSSHNEYAKSLRKRFHILSNVEELKNDDLLLPNPFNDDEPLMLRDNFAFYDFESLPPSDRKACQAEVYFIISVLFHYMRSPIMYDKKPKHEIYLVQHEHIRTLISPDNFNRFNDGIIQGCILRLATPAELDFSISYDKSYKMLTVLKDLFSEPNETGEAILEFLYSIAIGKLRLCSDHLSDFLKHIDKHFSSYPSIMFWKEAIEEYRDDDILSHLV